MALQNLPENGIDHNLVCKKISGGKIDKLIKDVREATKQYLGQIDTEQLKESIKDFANQQMHMEELRREESKDANLKKPTTPQPTLKSKETFVDDGFDYASAYQQYQEKK